MTGIAFLFSLASPAKLLAADYYVSATGTPAGNGSLSSPWDFQTALSTSVVQPGDHVWLLGGTYVAPMPNGYALLASGTWNNPIIYRNYNRERVIIDAGVTNCGLGAYQGGGYAWFWGLEMTSSAPLRKVSLTDPTPVGPGFCIYAPGIKVINSIVHDTSQGFSAYDAAGDAEITGNISYYNGFVRPDRPYGHGLYLQNHYGVKWVLDNVVFLNADEGMQIYGSGTAYVDHFRLTGNITFLNGNWPGYTPQYQMMINGGASRFDNQAASNFTYLPPEQGTGTAADFGDYTHGQGSTAITNNIFVGGNTSVMAGNDPGLVFTGNTVYNTGGLVPMWLSLWQGDPQAAYVVNQNTYYSGSGYEFAWQTGNHCCDPYGNLTGTRSYLNWSGWQSLGFDASGQFSQSPPTGSWVYVRQNRYETKRANVTIYNWGLASSVSVDLSNVLAVGDPFQIQDVENLSGQPLVSGVYAGSPVSIPMTSTAMDPIIGWTQPLHSDQRFGVFLVTSTNSTDSIPPDAYLHSPDVAGPLPIVTQQPQSATVNVGQSATFKVSVSSGTAVSYQWQSEPYGGSSFANIPGATSSTYTTPPSQATDNGTEFLCVMTNSSGTVTSDIAMLTVQSTGVPVITQQPQNATVTVGQSATFSVSTSGTGLSYQWQSQAPGASTFASIVGATNSIYTTPVSQLTDSGTQFLCVVSSGTASVPSSPATLTVQPPGSATTFVTSKVLGTLRNNYTGWVGMAIRVGANPVTVNALGRIVVSGSSGIHTVKLVNAATGADVPGGSVSVTASGGTPGGGFAYTTLANPVTLSANATYYLVSLETLGGDQWYDYNSAVQTTSAAVVTSAVYGAGPPYVITGTTGQSYGPLDFTYGPTGSGLPTITQQPQSATVTVGQSATFSVSASGTGLSYQWQSEASGASTFVNVSGATNSTYTTPASQSTDNGTAFQCVVTDSSGSVISATAMLTVQVIPLPVIVQQPQSATVIVGQSATFTVSASGTGLTYQWQSQTPGGSAFANIAGATGSTYTIPVTQLSYNGTQFLCVVSSASSPVSSAPAILSVQSVGNIAALAQSYPLNPYSRYQDGQWEGIRYASDGNVYFASSSQSAHHGAAFFKYNPVTQQLTLLAGDITTVVGENPQTNPQGKIHANIQEMHGWLFFTTHFGADDRPNGIAGYTGGHFVGYRLTDNGSNNYFNTPVGSFHDYGVIFSDSPGYTAYSGIAVDPVQNYVYVFATGEMPQQITSVFRYNPAVDTQATRANLGQVYGSFGASLYWFADSTGDVWFAIYNDNGALHRIHHDTQVIDKYDNVLPPFIRQDTNTVDTTFDRAVQLMVPTGPNTAAFTYDQGGMLYQFDATQATSNSVPASAFTNLKWIGPSYVGSALGNNRIFWYQRAGGAIGYQGCDTSDTTLPPACQDYHLMSVSLDPTTGYAITDHGLLVDQFGRTVWRTPSMMTDGTNNNVYLVGDWWTYDTNGNPIPGDEGVNNTLRYQYSNGVESYIDEPRGEFFAVVHLASVAGPPVITQQPQNATVTAGQTATFSVTAPGSGLSYQWQSMPPAASVFANIPGATASSYTTPPTQLTDSGTQFRCVVSNSVGPVNSSPALLAVQAPGVATAFVTSKVLGTIRNNYSGWVGMVIRVGSSPVTVNALGRIVVAGNTSSHTVKIVNGATGADVPGGSASVATAGGTPGSFAYGALSSPVTLSAGGIYYLMSLETFGGDQWYDHNSTVQTTNVAAVTSAVYGTAAPYVVVGSAGQSYGPLDFEYGGTGGNQPVVTQQPQNATVTVGQSATFSVSALGTGLSYQWQSMAPGSSVFTNIAGANASSYTTPVVQLTDSGTQFQCLVSNSNGTVNSATVSLTVIPAATGTAFVTSSAATILRNGFTGWVGMKITVGPAALSVSAVGRICVAGNSATHTVKFVSAANGADVAGTAQSVNMAGCSPGQFQYSSLAAPITLQQGATYYLVSQELQGGDQWYDHGPLSATNAAAVNSSIYFDGANWDVVDAANTSYVPPNFLYTAASPGSPFVSGYNLNNRPLRNDFTGWVGMKVTVGATPVTVSSLGRISVSGNSGTHTVKLVVASTGGDVPGGSVSLSMSGGTPGQFSYAALSSPITLQAKTTYYLVVQELQGGDQWYDYGTVSTAAFATVSSAIYWNGTGWVSVGGGNVSYVPPNFK